MRYLLFVRTPEEGARLASRLSPAEEAAVVCPGTAFAARAGGRYDIDPGAPEDYERLLAGLPALPERILYGWPWQPQDPPADPDAVLPLGVTGAFLLARALLARKPASAVAMLYVFARPGTGAVPLHDAAGAFARTVAHESRKLVVKLVSLAGGPAAPPSPDLSAHLPALTAEFESRLDEHEVRYLDGTRQRRVFRPAGAVPDPAAPLPFRDGGVYLVTGGTGGLGAIVARHIASRHRARLALVGRRPADAAIAALLDELDFLGASASYHAADIGDAEAAAALVARVRADAGPLNGVIQGAGIHRDALIAKKDPADFRAVLRPKVHGTLNLDRATRDEPLDTFVCFSSIAGLLGNMGQADYSYANGFLDAFARLREERRQAGARRGRTLSINWPLWRNGGMQVDEQVRIFAERSLGMAPLATETGLRLFEDALRLGGPQLFVGQGDARKIGSWFGLGPAAPVPEAAPVPASIPAPAPAAAAPADDAQVLKAVQADLIAGVVEILEVDPKDADVDTDLSGFGFDSITFTTFGNRITEALGVEISPVVFFEYQTIRELSEYMLQEHRGALVAWHRHKSGSETAPAAAPLPPPVAIPAPAPLSVAPIAVPPPPAAPRVPAMAGAAGDEPIAIIGIDGMLPQSPDLDIFWDHLAAGRDLVTEVPPERWDWRSVWGDPFQEKNRTRIKWGGFVPDIDAFDAAFFNISAREAERMDPQHRLFLQTVWRCIEDAGYRASTLAERSKVGLFCGSASIDYHDIMLRSGIDIDVFAVTGSMFSVLVNRISYLLNFRGPSEPVETACSSSLVAIHRAIHAIRAGECEVAVAGGVHLMMGPYVHIGLDKGGFLSQQGRCATFDKDADGYVRGEGCVAVMLKPLSRAEADGDHVHALILGSAVNHGGKVNTLTTPNPNAQTEVVVDAWKRAGVDPRSISYVEAHGTGTALGDPIEIKALRRAFDELYEHWGLSGEPREKHCGIGSVKTNIGHLEFVAGISGLAKMVLAMRHGTLPANIHFNAVNPYIDLGRSPLHIVDAARPWERPRDASGREAPRRAGVSSFGFGGVNCHMALEEYRGPAEIPASAGGRPQAVTLSARTPEALAEMAGRLRRHLDRHPGLSLGDVAFTLAAGREAMAERLVVVADDLDGLRHALDGDIERPVPGRLYRGSRKAGAQRLAFLKSREEAVRFARTVLEEGRLETMAQHWVDGLDFDWSETVHARGRRRPLPTYPFARTRYWIEAPPAGPGPAGDPGAAAEPDALGREVLSMLGDGLLTEEQAKELLLA